jgi:hypothetical protein
MFSNLLDVFTLIQQVAPKSNASCALDLKYAGKELTFRSVEQPVFLSHDELRNCMVFTRKGQDGVDRLYWSRNNELVSTQGMRGKHANRAAYAMDAQGRLYLHEHVTRQSHSDMTEPFFHSSFFSGRPGKCFGMIEVVNGRVEHLNNYSGHYRPTYEHLLDVENRLKHVLSESCQVCHANVQENKNNSDLGLDMAFGW